MAIALKYKWQSLNLVIVLLGVALCAAQWPSEATLIPLSPWRQVKLTQEAVQPLHPPVWIDSALLWRPLGAAVLVYQSLDGQVIHRYDWLRGTPIQWQALVSPAHTYLMWRTLEGALWVALLSPTGEQLTAPVVIAEREVEAFTAVLTPQGEISLAWGQGGAWQARPIDSQARPLPSVNITEQADQMTLAVDAAGQVVIFWQSQGDLWQAQLDPTQRPYQLANRRLLGQVSLTEQEWVSSVDATALEGDSMALLWGISHASAPDQARYQGLILSGQTDPLAFDLTIPDITALRWADLSGDQVALAAKIEGQWRAALLGLGGRGPQGYQLLPGPAVTASPIAYHDQSLAWITLDAAQNPRLVIQTLNPAWGELNYAEPARPGLRNVLEAGLQNAPYGLVWLIAPALLYGLTLGRPYGPSVALGVYWLGKALLAGGLWTTYPPILSAWGLDSGVIGGLALLLAASGLAGLLGTVGWGQTPHPLRHAAYCLTDWLLTCAILGASLQ
jgi:hypothetical protein